VSAASTSERYVLLGLRLGRHVDGLVDAYYGPEELSRQVESEPVAEPQALVADAEALLDGLEDGWLRDQTVGLRTYAGVLAGEELVYSDEVEGCYGVRPARVSTDVYAAALDQLDRLLPGSGSLMERHEAWRQSQLVPEEHVVPAVGDVAVLLRERTNAVVELPGGEGFELEEEHDEPWWAFNYYLGGLRSRVEVNVDIPTVWDDVVELAGHEIYPGHHTEHALKEQLLLREAGRLEECIQLVPTPAALVSEGIAEVGRAVVSDEEVLEEIETILRSHGMAGDLSQAHAIREARRPLRRVMLDAALLLHEDGGSAEEAKSYFERWHLDTPELAAHGVRFVSDPTWRAYAITYSAGGELCRAWVGDDKARLASLLTEHVRVRDLLAAVSSTT
jgi:hypothetical protein